MTTGQRGLLLMGSIAFAASLHATFFEWSYKRSTTMNGVRAAVWCHRHGPDATRSNRHLASGLWPQTDTVPLPLATTYGLIVPLLLSVGVPPYLVLGWRRERSEWRVGCGLCARCGYDLRGSSDTAGGQCPECGWRRGP